MSQEPACSYHALCWRVKKLVLRRIMFAKLLFLVRSCFGSQCSRMGLSHR
jgi:hypothetical protein